MNKLNIMKNTIIILLLSAFGIAACTQEVPPAAPITIVGAKPANDVGMRILPPSEIAPGTEVRPIVSELCYKGILYLLIGTAVTPRLGGSTGLPMTCQ